MSTFTYPKAGLGNVGSYQMSGVPFLTSSLAVPASPGTPIVVEFPYVTRFITVTNTVPATSASAPLRFGFSEEGVQGTVNNNYLVLDNGESFEAEFRVTKIFLIADTTFASSGSVAAGLTGITAAYLINNWSGSAGVG